MYIEKNTYRGDIMIINIDNVLKDNNKTIYWLAKQIGMTYPNLTKLCNGKTESIRFDLLNKICNVLNCNIDDILIITPLTHD